jgi:uncharacterized protein (TIGR02145 family)
MTKQQTINNVEWTKIGNLEWSEYLGEMNWKQACEECKRLGGRLPARDKLINLYDNYWNEARMENDWYWSSTEYGSSYAWYVYFNSGGVDGNASKNYSFSVRCVRDIINS